MSYIKPEINTATIRTVSRETNDCTVRALAVAANIPYDQAHALMAKHGRKFRQGTMHKTQLKAYTEAGGELRAIFGSDKGARYRALQSPDVPVTDGITLKTLLEKIPMGRFVVIVKGHAFAVVNRKVADSGMLKAGTRINAVYRFDNVSREAI